MRWPLLLAAFLALALGGCSYMRQRGADLADIFVVELTAGQGADVHAQITNLFGTGLGSSRQDGFVWRGRRFGLGGRESEGIVVSAMTWAYEARSRAPRAAGEPVPVDTERLWFALIRHPLFVPAFSREELPNLLNIEVGASLFVGFHVGFNPIQALDFLLGWTTLDICHDDYPYDQKSVTDHKEETAS